MVIGEVVDWFLPSSGLFGTGSWAIPVKTKVSSWTVSRNPLSRHASSSWLERMPESTHRRMRGKEGVGSPLTRDSCQVHFQSQ